jgi:hypothetical protein
VIRKGYNKKKERKEEKRKERKGLNVEVNTEKYLDFSEKKLLYGIYLPVNTPIYKRRKISRT